MIFITGDIHGQGLDLQSRIMRSEMMKTHGRQDDYMVDGKPVTALGNVKELMCCGDVGLTYGKTGRKPGAWDWILGYLRMRYQLRTGITSSNETLARGITVRHLSRKRNSDGYSVPWIVRVVLPTRLIIMIMARSAGDESAGSDLRGTCVLQACITSCAARTPRTEDTRITRP